MLDGPLLVSNENGCFLKNSDAADDHELVDLHGAIIAPGFIELQTNGMRAFHFTHFDDADSYAEKLNRVASYLPTQGVTAFYATIPTVASEEFQKVR